MSPSHIEFKEKIKVGKRFKDGVIANYTQPAYLQFKAPVHIDINSERRPLVCDWKVGMELPLDP